MGDASAVKAALRREMRVMRRSLADRPARSALITATLQELPAVVAAGTVMAFTSVVGEPETALFVQWCRSNGKVVVMPEDDPAPLSLDVVIVPGTAFTPAGDRLGQGGGWYDRFLDRIRLDCTVIGVCFDEQLVDELPTEPHDVRMEFLVTPTRIFQAADRDGS